MSPCRPILKWPGGGGGGGRWPNKCVWEWRGLTPLRPQYRLMIFGSFNGVILEERGKFLSPLCKTFLSQDPVSCFCHYQFSSMIFSHCQWSWFLVQKRSRYSCTSIGFDRIWHTWKTYSRSPQAFWEGKARVELCIRIKIINLLLQSWMRGISQDEGVFKDRKKNICNASILISCPHFPN